MLSRVSVEHTEVLGCLLYSPALDFVKEMSQQTSLQLSSLKVTQHSLMVEFVDSCMSHVVSEISCP